MWSSFCIVACVYYEEFCVVFRTAYALLVYVILHFAGYVCSVCAVFWDVPKRMPARQFSSETASRPPAL